MNGYYRVLYRSKNNGFWENYEPTPQNIQNDAFLFIFLKELRVKSLKQGLIPVTDPSSVEDKYLAMFVDKFYQGGDYPDVMKRDGLTGIFVEFRTLSTVESIE